MTKQAEWERLRSLLSSVGYVLLAQSVGSGPRSTDFLNIPLINWYCYFCAATNHTSFSCLFVFFLCSMDGKDPSNEVTIGSSLQKSLRKSEANLAFGGEVQEYGIWSNMLLTDSLHFSRQGERWVDMQSCVSECMHTCAHKLYFRVESCQMLFGYNTPSPVIYVTVLAQTLENHSYVLPGGDNVPKQRPS